MTTLKERVPYSAIVDRPPLRLGLMTYTLGKDWDVDTIIKNFNIRSFLETNQKRYVVGPKGSGKTLLLLRKAIDQRSVVAS